MDYTINPSDQAKIDHHAKYDRILKFIKRKDDFKFNIGDVLIKSIKSSYGDHATFKTEKVSHVSDANRKFLYFFENEEGIGFVKPILADGNPGLDAIPMTEYDPDSVKFELDPEYADHIILSDEGEHYDALADHKRRKKFREKAYKANKKICIPMSTVDDRMAFFNNLKVGDKFYKGSSMDDMLGNQVEVVSIDTSSLTDQWEIMRWDRLKINDPSYAKYQYRKVEVKVLHTSNTYYSQLGTTYTMKTDEIYGWFITFQTPTPMTEDIG